MTMSRRKFLGASSAAVIAGGMMAKGKVWGANDRIMSCTIGFNGQGNDHIRHCVAQEGVEIGALCDVDARVLKEGVEKVGKAQNGRVPKAYKDLRDVMDDKDIDVITTATPNHWHALITVWGCMAGKDVYVEKPMSHSPWESRQCVKAAEKYGQIVQHGTQSRSDATWIRDVGLMRKGFIGEIVHSRGYVYKNGNRRAIGHGAKGPVPDYLDWMLWQGPAKDVPFQINVDRKNKPGLHVHYDWHWFWEYGNGEIGNQGVHQMDIACWMMGDKKPVKVASTGGRYAWDDDAETPNTQATHFTYADGTMTTFEVRNLGSFYEGNDIASSNSCFGETGYYVQGKGFFDYKNNPIPVEEEAVDNGNKFDRFFRAVRSRKQSDAPMTVEESHHACLHCQLGNIAYRVGETLEFDPKTEKFKSSKAGNKMLKRDYRKGFEVPNIG